MAEDVHHLDRATGPIRPTVVGHSMGGKICNGARADGDPVRSATLVVVDIAPVSRRPLHALRRGRCSIDAAATASRTEAQRRLIERLPTGDRALPAAELVSRNDHFDWRLNLAAIGISVPSVEVRFRPRCSVAASAGLPRLIYGAARTMWPRRTSKVSVSVPGVRGARDRGCGHWVHAEKPDAFPDRSAVGLLDPSRAAEASPTGPAGRRRVVIVGGGAGGLELGAAGRHPRQARTGRDTLIDRNHACLRPYCTKIAAGSMDTRTHQTTQAHWHHFRYRRSCGSSRPRVLRCPARMTRAGVRLRHAHVVSVGSLERLRRQAWPSIAMKLETAHRRGSTSARGSSTPSAPMRRSTPRCDPSTEGGDHRRRHQPASSWPRNCTARRARSLSGWTASMPTATSASA